MLTVETIARVRREHAKGMSARQIARSLKLSRETVSKYLQSGATAVRYERQKQTFPQLGAHLKELEAILEENERRHKRDRKDYKAIFAALVQIGYQGGYDAVRRFCKQWKLRHKPGSGISQAFVPLIYYPAEAYQFDWAEDHIFLDGALTKVQVAHVRLCHSRMPYVRVYPRQKQEMVFDAHEQAFRFWGGTCERGIYDNMKTAVDTVYVGKDRKFNRRFEQMCSHYLIEPTACTPRAGWEKGQVESQVGKIRQSCFTPRPRVQSLDDLNGWLEEQCIVAAKATPHPEIPGKTVWDVFETEREVLVKTAGSFDGFREIDVPASKTCLIRFDCNRYSVEAKAAGKPVQLRIYAERLEIRLEGELVAEHRRSFGRGRTIYNPLHYIPILARKPGALRNGAPFREWSMPPALAGVQARIGRSNDGDRQFADILAAVLTDGLDAVEAACAEALANGPCSKDVVLTILARRRTPPPPPADVSAALVLTIAPAANCNRYNALLSHAREAAHGTA
ncbi:MAG: IS21 family transposase [Rhodospirillaceae bacterium]